MATSQFSIGGSVHVQGFAGGRGFLFNAGEYGIYEITSLRFNNSSPTTMTSLAVWIDTRATSTGTDSSARASNTTNIYAFYENIAPRSWINVIDKNNPVYLYNNNTRSGQDGDGPIIYYNGSSASSTYGVLLYRYYQNDEYSEGTEGSFGLRGTRIDQNWG